MVDMQQYVDEVRMRMSRYAVVAELDPAQIEMYINRARHDVQMATLQVYPERYSRVLTVNSFTEVPEYARTLGTVTRRVYSALMPVDFLRDVVVRVNNEDQLYGCRRINKRELFQIMNNTWNGPTQQNPVYCVEKDTTAAQHTIYISGGDLVIADDMIELWYLAVLPDLQLYNAGGNADSEIRIGADYEEMVILVALLKAVEKLGTTAALQAVVNDVSMNIAMMELNYKRAVDRAKLMLPSRESIIPNVPIMTNQPGVQDVDV